MCVGCRHVAQYQPGGEVSPRCPSCQTDLVDAGRDFAAPRKTDTDGWRKVALLLEAGVGFDSCGCNGPGPRPGTLADAKAAAALADRFTLPLPAVLAGAEPSPAEQATVRAGRGRRPLRP